MDDYISREAALTELQNPELFNVSPRFLQILRDLPAADVEPVRHGRWISWEDADNCIPSPNRHECSVCHDAAQVLVNNIELLSNYCPNCGAKMCLDEDTYEM